MPSSIPHPAGQAGHRIDLAVLHAAETPLGTRLRDLALIHASQERTGSFHLYSAVIDDGSQVRLMIERPAKNPTRPGTLRLPDQQGTSVDLWAFPADPELPALPMCVHPEALATLLTRLGLSEEIRAVQVRRYHPSERALVQASTSRGTRFIKVVRPEAMGPLLAAHSAWSAAPTPVATLLGSGETGWLIFAELPGTEGETLLASGSLTGTHLDLVDRAIATFPTETATLASLPSLRSVVHIATESLRTMGHSCGDLLTVIDEIEHRHPSGAVRPIHGDLHVGQFLFDGLDLGGLLDLDDAGVGEPAQDAGRLHAHLLARSLELAPGPSAIAHELAADWRTRWDAQGQQFAARAGAWSLAWLLTHARGATVAKDATTLLQLARHVVA